MPMTVGFDWRRAAADKGARESGAGTRAGMFRLTRSSIDRSQCTQLRGRKTGREFPVGIAADANTLGQALDHTSRSLSPESRQLLRNFTVSSSIWIAHRRQAFFPREPAISM